MTLGSFKPRFHQTLQSLGLDVHYHRASGNYVYHCDAQGEEQAVLDLVGGYGALLLGHNHPTLVAEAQKLLQNQCPSHTQASRREPAARLAAALAERAGADYLSLFASSGAEAVEIALKHAMLQTGNRTFIALSEAFHGKTLAALQLTASPEFRESFELAGLNVIRVPRNDTASLDRAFHEAHDLAGFLYEPVLGEGGVFPLAGEFVQRAATLCKQRRVPLIADECQTGVGRTGTFLASTPLGVQPDYLILSKTLGGGLAKISATLIKRRLYRDAIDLKHTSTFAEDDFSCALALKTLELIDSNVLLDCRNKGARLLAALQGLATRYPTVIADARGRGLMLGLEFRPRPRSDSFLLRMFSDRADLGFLVMAYLFHAHQIRVSPTLSRPLMLRLQPSVLLEQLEQDRLLLALEDVCQKLNAEEGGSLAGVLGNRPAALPITHVRTDRLLVYDRRRVRADPPPPVQVAWLCHLVDETDLVSLEPGTGELSGLERENLLSRLILRGAPVLVSGCDIESATGARLRFHTIMLPFTSQWARRCLTHGGSVLPLIQNGVDLAASLGCQMISLGQYTSILSRNGLKVDSGEMGLTTGNSYAVALAREVVQRAQNERSLDPKRCTLVVVGAAGNIGRACAQILAPAYRRTRLVGSTRRGSLQRLNRLAASLPNASVTTDLDAVQDGQTVVAALNAVDAPLGPQHFRTGSIVCDLSVPAGLHPDLAAARPDLLLVRGGLARLPNRENLDIIGFPLPPGQVYGCMAEGALLGWEGKRHRQFTGSITAEHVCHIEALAVLHGFKLAAYITDNVLERRSFALVD